MDCMVAAVERMALSNIQAVKSSSRNNYKAVIAAESVKIGLTTLV